jgi:predicted dehydrogenase
MESFPKSATPKAILMIKVLLLGLGRWGVNHLRVLHSLPVELFVTDLQAKQLDAARKLGVAEDHLATDHRTFATRVNAIIVVTPAPTHFPLCREFIEAGKDVFVEKPITLASGEAKQLAELAERRQRILQVGHIFRFDTASQWLRDAIQDGRFGQVRMLRSNFSGFKRPRNDSGVCFADAIHFVDLFNYFLGRTPTRVSAIMKDFLGRGVEDASLLSLEYDGPRGTTWALIETNYFLPGKFREVVVVGDALSAVCDYNVAQYKIRTFQNQHVMAGTDFKAEEGAVRQIECAPEEPLLTELRAFVNSVQTRAAPRADGWAGYNSVRVLELAMESAKSGRTLEMK